MFHERWALQKVFLHWYLHFLNNILCYFYQWHLFKKQQIYFHIKFQLTISIHSWDKTTSGFGKTGGRHIGIQLPVPTCVVIVISFSICLPNFVVIGRFTAELWRHIDFSRWRSYSRKCTSGCRLSDCICLRRWKSICMPNFDEINSTKHGWDKTTSGFGKRTAAILEFYFRSRFSPYCRFRRVILHRPTKFRQNQITLGGVMTSCPFFKMAAGSHIGFDLGNLDHTRRVIADLALIFKFGLDPIHSFGDMAISIFVVLAWNCLFAAIFAEFWGHIPQKIWGPSF